jgi:hypothetical protein
LGWAGLAEASEIVLTFVVPGAHAERMQTIHAAQGRAETFFTPQQMAAVLEEPGSR